MIGKVLLFLSLSIFACFSSFSQTYILPNTSFNQDLFFDGRQSLGLEFGYRSKLLGKLKFHASLNVEYAFEKKSKTEFYSNYAFKDLTGNARSFVLNERFLVRKQTHRTLFLSPKLHIGIPVNFSFLDLEFFSGVNPRLRIYNKNVWYNVLYFNNFTETEKKKETYRSSAIYSYNVYIPLGLIIKTQDLPIFLYFNYGLGLKSASFDIPFSWGEHRHDNIQVGIGFDL